MFTAPYKRASSSMPHLALMVSGLLSAILIGFIVMIGWRWYFGEVDRRRELARLSALADENISQHAAMQSARIKESTRAATAPRGPLNVTPNRTSDTGKPGVSLTELPRPQTDVVFVDPEPIQEDVSPERLRAAVELQKQFLAAPTWRERLDCIADPQRVGPLMHNYYEVQKGTDPVAGDAIHQAHFKLNSTEVLLFSYSSPRPSGTLDMAMVATNGGRFVLDWESYVGAGEMSWTEFKKQRPTEPKLFRAFVNQDDYYNYEFTDEKRFLSFHLASADGFYSVKGYCERNSPIGVTLGELFTGGSRRMALTLRLVFPEKALSDHCVRIVGVVANRWLIVP